MSELSYDVADGVATITFNRADKLNAFTGAMMHRMIELLDEIDADDAVRATIVTGEGRAFCAGADISGGADGFYSAGEDSPYRADGSIDYAHPAARDGGGLLALRLYRCVKPLIAAINGPAVGIGATMTLPMDIRLASANARFGFVFAKRGIVTDAAASWFLPRVVGIAQALDWTLTGELFDAEEAFQAGLVKQVLPPDELLPRAYEIAGRIVRNTAPVSIALIRQMMWRSLGMEDPMDAHRVESRGIVSRSRSADAAEGVAAFLEKRAPSFPQKVSRDMPDFYPWWTDRPFS